MEETWLRYTVLPVGQGAGAFVQLWEGPTRAGPDRFSETDATPVEAALIDLGSLGWKPTAGEASAKFVAEQLKKMKPPKPPRLDAVFLSHSDSDHTNLLKNLFEYFSPPGTPPTPQKPTLTVTNSWFGGLKEDYKKAHNDPLGLLESYGADPKALGTQASSWPLKGGGSPVPLHGTGDIKYLLLIGNTQAPGDDTDEDDESAVEAVDGSLRSRKRGAGSDSETRNVVSLVLVLAYGSTTERRIVATGDATGLTLAFANKVIEKNRIPLAPVLTVSLPHHGSESSTYDVGGARAATMEQVVKDFVSKLGPESITASAAERGTYRHPASRVIAAFAEATGSGMYSEGGLGDEHFFTAHYPQSDLPLRNGGTRPDGTVVNTWPPSQAWYTGRTKRNVFTIDYTRGDPRGVSLPAISFATPGNPQAKPTALLDGRSLPAADLLPPQAAGWGYYVSSDGGTAVLKRLVDVASVPRRAALEAVHGPLPPDRFVFLSSAPAPESAEEPPPPPPAVVPEAPRRRAGADFTRRPRQLP